MTKSYRHVEFGDDLFPNVECAGCKWLLVVVNESKTREMRGIFEFDSPTGKMVKKERGVASWEMIFYVEEGFHGFSEVVHGITRAQKVEIASCFFSEQDFRSNSKAGVNDDVGGVVLRVNVADVTEIALVGMVLAGEF